MIRGLPVALLLAAACRVDAPAPVEAPPATPAPDAAPAAPTSPVVGGSGDHVPASPSVPEAEPVGWTRVDLRIEDGALDVQLREQLAKARADGQVAFVQLFADWCAPCRELRTSMSDARMQEAFRGTRILRLDANVWGGVFYEMFPGQFAIPAFYVVRDDGTLGAGVTGNAWGANEPANMAPVLGKFFREAAAPTPTP